MLAIPADWHAARMLLAAWEEVVQVKTAVGRRHRLLYVHVLVRRTLPPGRLALRVIWYNHRVFTCGVRKGLALCTREIADAPLFVAAGLPTG